MNGLEFPWLWKSFQIGDLCEAVETIVPERRGKGNFRYVDISSINNEQKVITSVKIMANQEAPSRARQVILAYDVLVSTVRPNLNAVAIVPQDLNDEICSTGFCVLRAKRDILDPEFLFAWVRHPNFIKALVRLEQGIGYPAVRDKDIKQTNIPLPSLPEQRRIVDILREADEIRRLRKQANEKAKQLLYSFFQEMFGDPSTNPKGWSYGTLRDVVNSVQDGPHISPKYSHEGIPFLSTRNVRAGEIIWEDLKFISRQDAEKHWKKCKPVLGDILYTKGGTTGLAKAIDFDTEIAIWVHIALLKPDRSKVNPLWLENMLNSRFCYDQSQLLTHGIANRDLGITRIPNIKLYIPPLSLQEEFAAQAQEIRETISKQVEALTKADDLFQSLLAQAFTGELTATWREQHQEELAAAVAEFDQPLQISQSVDTEELAGEVPSKTKRSELHGDRDELLRNFSKSQWKIYELVIQETVYFTPEHLEEKYSIPRKIGHKSLQLLAAAGLIVSVTLPTPTSSGLHYESAYRNLNQDDDTRYSDDQLLNKDAV
jgi:type I restriction enzyme S subunit